MSEQGIALYENDEMKDFVLNRREYAGELTIEVAATEIAAVLQTLRDKFGYTYLADITGTDHFEDERRFSVAYNLVNMDEAKRLRIECFTEEEHPEVPSTISVYPAAAWFEREVFDMLGILFPGNPDLRRIYMPEDFEYFPLRKEFPLIGIPGSIQVPDKVPPKGYK